MKVEKRHLVIYQTFTYVLTQIIHILILVRKKALSLISFTYFLHSSVSICQFSHNLLKMICLHQAIWQKICSVIIFFRKEPKITQIQLLAMQLPSGGAGSNASHCFPHPRMAIPHFNIFFHFLWIYKNEEFWVL